MKKLSRNGKDSADICSKHASSFLVLAVTPGFPSFSSQPHSYARDRSASCGRYRKIELLMSRKQQYHIDKQNRELQRGF